MANLNAIVEFFQKNPQILTQLTSGKLDLNGIVSMLKQQGVNAAVQEVQEYLTKNVNATDLGSIAGSLLGGNKNSEAADVAGAVLGGLGSLLGKK